MTKEPTRLTDLTRQEAEAIADNIDPKAGGFFRDSMVKAALLAAHEQRLKIEKVEKAAEAAAKAAKLTPEAVKMAAALEGKELE